MTKFEKLFILIFIIYCILKVAFVFNLRSLTRAIRENERAIGGQADRPLKMEIRYIEEKEE